jgi:thiamine pyrophosphokinase
MKVILPQGSLELHNEFKKPIVLVAGGRRPDSTWLKKFAGNMSVYAADRGADYCVDSGLKIATLYGDQDSATPSKWQQGAKDATVKTFPVAKDSTDLELLLGSIPAATLVLATGIWGGRADHLYANMLIFLAWQDKNAGRVIMADEKEVMVFLEKKEHLVFASQEKPFAVSILPFSPTAEVSISGVTWPLKHYKMSSDNPGYTVSNTMVEDEVEIECQTGKIGFYLYFK